MAWRARRRLGSSSLGAASFRRGATGTNGSPDTETTTPRSGSGRFARWRSAERKCCSRARMRRTVGRWESVFTEAEEHFGAIHGVVHAAGADKAMSLFAETTRDDCERQLAPKTEGAARARGSVGGARARLLRRSVVVVRDPRCAGPRFLRGGSQLRGRLRPPPQPNECTTLGQRQLRQLAQLEGAREFARLRPDRHVPSRPRRVRTRCCAC